MSTDNEQLRLLAVCAEVKQVIFRFANALDLQDWDLLRSCFNETIEVDYSDFRGEKRTISADDFVAQRRHALTGIKTQHLSFNHEIRIENERAFCYSASLIFRFDPAMKSENFFNTHCCYEHILISTPEGWKIAKIRQIVLWNEGNPNVHGFHRAQDAVAETK